MPLSDLIIQKIRKIATEIDQDTDVLKHIEIWVDPKEGIIGPKITPFPEEKINWREEPTDLQKGFIRISRFKKGKTRFKSTGNISEEQGLWHSLKVNEIDTEKEEKIKQDIKDNWEIITKHLHILSDKQREAFSWRMHGLSLRQGAKAMRVSKTTFREYLVGKDGSGGAFAHIRTILRQYGKL